MLLELGGNSPAIVLVDADLPMAARACAMGAFLLSAPIYMFTERIVVEKGISAEFADEVSPQNSTSQRDMSSHTVSWTTPCVLGLE